MAKSVSSQKPIDNSKYEKSLTKTEKDIYNLYVSIADNRDESKLLSLVKSGELKCSDVNKEGTTPLMLAVDNKFSAETI